MMLQCWNGQSTKQSYTYTIDRTKQKPKMTTEKSDFLAERTCHMLPCNIDMQGMAPTHKYFQPIAAPLDDDGTLLLSSTLRGRGLLATTREDTKNPCVLLSIQHNQVHVKAEMDRLVEWQHEHNPQTVQLESSSRLCVANEWLEVADAVRSVARSCRCIRFCPLHSLYCHPAACTHPLRERDIRLNRTLNLEITGRT